MDTDEVVELFKKIKFGKIEKRIRDEEITGESLTYIKNLDMLVEFNFGLNTPQTQQLYDKIEGFIKNGVSAELLQKPSPSLSFAEASLTEASQKASVRFICNLGITMKYLEIA